MRVLLGGLGVLAIGYGALRLLELPLGALVAVGLWLAAGVILHDGLLSGALAGAGGLVARLPRVAAYAVAVTVVVLGPLTLAAVPVLGRFGVRPYDPTLLDGHYPLAWGMLAVVVAVGAVLVARRTARRGPRKGR